MQARRVVITGLGIVSPLGNDAATVLEALREGRSGIERKQSYVDNGLRTQVAGTVKQYDELVASVDRKLARFMGDAALYAYVAMRQAVEDSGLEADVISHPRTGVIAGSGGGSPINQIEGWDVLQKRGVRRVGAFRVPRIMGNTVAANLATAYQIKGINYSITSACATSIHTIGAAYEQIQLGKQDVVFAGGGEEESAELTAFFDAMGAVSTHYNDTPATASRPYDANRDGFVAAGGGAILVVEDYEHAKARGAKIYAEIVGYAANSDGADMVAPSGEGAVRCMKAAMETVDGSIDYINTHGTSTPAGDITELQAIHEVFGDQIPPISSTKALTGHSLGATGGQEAVYCILMMLNDFICGSAHIQELDPAAVGFPILREATEAKLNRVLTNSFGFGGTNGCLILQRV
ncbi:MAG: 3-oxoacyl-acyl-carrier-protein synthase I [Puniceicoccaceae bacterium 5H]|nr:MAG: 3-oxoacyl-acyl-carrier-protein synthase I [Puniceicoccaceae bacterium 5H]